MDEVIVIRVDGNSEIGFGHLIRMEALAQQLEKRGAKVIILSRNPENIRGFQTVPLNPDPGFIGEDEMVGKIINHYGGQMLIIDSYAYEQERLELMAGLEILSVYIDDLNRHAFNVDYVVNGNLYAPKLNYQGRAEFLLGSKYLMIREEFSNLPYRKVGNKVEDVLISFGAADMENATPYFIEILLAYKNFYRLNWHVVIGPVFRNTNEIEALVQGKVNVFLHYNPDIKNLMEKCDISINAAGSTTYELAACGVPALLVAIADNQVKLASEADMTGFASSLGWYRDLQAPVLFWKLDSLIENLQLRQSMVDIGQHLFDGRGSSRVSDILLQAMRRKDNEGINSGKEDISNRWDRDSRQDSGSEADGI